MAIKDSLLPEFDHEMGATRRVLERVPVADLAWKPHDKSFSLGQLAGHVANIPRWLHAILDLAVFDLASVGDDARPKQPTEVDSILKSFDEEYKKTRAKLNEQERELREKLVTFLEEQGHPPPPPAAAAPRARKSSLWSALRSRTAP